MQEWISAAPVDMVLVIRTNSSVFAVAEFVELARARCARLVMVNTDEKGLFLVVYEIVIGDLSETKHCL